jgi:hypothetical protein
MNFVTEIFVRLFGKTPWFFKAVQIISAIIAVILLGPDLIEAIEQGGFELPVSWKEFVSRAVGIATLVSTFVAQLAVTKDVKEREGIKD